MSCLRSSFKEEVKNNLKLGIPIIVTNILQYILFIETTSFAGRLSDREFAGTGLALSLIHAFGWTICTGMVSACDTMMSQAYGSDNKKRTGLFLQRAVLMMNMIPIVLWCIHLNMECILAIVGQDPKIARVAGEFLQTFLPGFTFMLNYLILARYMQTQNKIFPPIFAAICGNVLNVCGQLIFVHYLGYGFRAGAVCFSLSYGLMFLIELLYIVISKFYIPTWPGFQMEAFYDWGQMFVLGLAGMAHTSFEVIIWQACVFMGGLLGDTQLETNSLIIQFTTLSFMLYLGIGIGSNIRVGQCLGSGDSIRAKTAYRVAITIIGFIGTLMTSLIMCFYHYIPQIFTDKQNVINMARSTLPSVFLLIFLDPFSGVCIGCIRGCGRQKFGAAVMFIAFYLLALPISIALAFKTYLNIKGIWIGNTIGSFVAVTMDVLMLECQNWDKQSIKAIQRITYTSCPNKEQTKINNPDERTKLLNESKNDRSHKRILLKRLVIFVCVLLLLTASIIIRLNLPLLNTRNFTIIISH